MNGEPDLAPKATAIGARGAAEVFAVFLRLGLTSFGGPIAHLGYFHNEFVVRRNWLRVSGDQIGLFAGLSLVKRPLVIATNGSDKTI
jgi:hypothetical protein